MGKAVARQVNCRTGGRKKIPAAPPYQCRRYSHVVRMLYRAYPDIAGQDPLQACCRFYKQIAVFI